MKNTLGLLFVLFLFFASSRVIAQVGGLSNSKLFSLSVGVVGDKKIEFEPSFYHVRAKKYYDGDQSLQNIYSTSDSTRAETGMGFRFTYGLWDRLEIGTYISTDLTVSSWGARFVAYQSDKIGVAVIAGANIPFGNRGVDGKTNLSQLMTSIGGGGVFSASFTENFSIDVNAQYMFFLKETENNSKGSWYLSTDIGYFFFDQQLQVIGGIGYQNAVFEDFNNQKLTIYPGITVSTGKNYVIIVSAPFDVFGENALKNAGINFALTLTFN